jgi:hypothetical protein
VAPEAESSEEEIDPAEVDGLKAQVAANRAEISDLQVSYCILLHNGVC